MKYKDVKNYRHGDMAAMSTVEKYYTNTLVVTMQKLNAH
jgi:hypothetical protein